MYIAQDGDLRRARGQMHGTTLQRSQEQDADDRQNAAEQRPTILRGVHRQRLADNGVSSGSVLTRWNAMPRRLRGGCEGVRAKLGWCGLSRGFRRDLG